MTQMTDLEMVKRCAEKMGLDFYEVERNEPEHTIRLFGPALSNAYWPLHDDAQCMALAKKFALGMDYNRLINQWHVIGCNADTVIKAQAANVNLNRAIVECVARLP